MVSLMRRRAMMQNASGELPEWDYEWDYTMGLPTDLGWELGTKNDGSVTLTDSYLKMSSGSSAYRFFNLDEAASETGVIEVDFLIPSTAKTSLNFTIARFGNSTTAEMVCMWRSSGDVRSVKRFNNSTLQNGTTIGYWEFDTNYTLRITLDNGNAEIRLNNNALFSGRAGAAYKGAARFGVQNSNGAYTNFTAVRLKVGRTS